MCSSLLTKPSLLSLASLTCSLVKHVTAPAGLLMVKLIDEKLLKEKDSDTQLTKDIIKHDLLRRYPDSEQVTDILKISTFLDSHFKTNYVKGAELTRVKDKLIEEASDCQDHLSVPAGQDSGSPSSNHPPKKRNLGTKFKEQEQTHDHLSILSPEQQFSAELTLYENAPMLDFEEDPLLWCKLSSHTILLSEEVFSCLCY